MTQDDYELKIRIAVSEAFKNIPLDELLNIVSKIQRDLLTLYQGKLVLEKFVANK